MQKKIPMRLCTGCNQKKPKNELVRVVRTPENNIVLDLTGKLSGRGAYICKDGECLNLAKRKKRFESAFSCPVPMEVYDRIEKELSSVE